MAEINVERKDTSIWPWILGLLLLALLAWGVYELLDDDTADVAEAPLVVPGPAAPVVDPAAAPAVPTDQTAANIPAAVTEYANTCAQPMDASANMGLQHDFTANCVQRLVDALDAVIVRNNIADTNVQQRLTSMRQTAQNLRASPAEATNHANMTREAFAGAADLMQAVHQAGYSTVAPLGTAVSEAQTAAQNVQADMQMLNQQQAVHNFFREAGDAVRMMAETPVAM